MIYVLGARDRVEVYDVDQNQWNILTTKMPRYTGVCSVAALDGKIYVT